MASNHHQVFSDMAEKACLTPASRGRVLFQIGKLLEKKSKDNALGKGGKSFWQDVAKSVTFNVNGETSVTIGASHRAGAFRHKGGVISAPGKGVLSRDRKFLTIPLPWCPKGKSTVDQYPRDSIGFARKKDGRMFMGVLEPTGKMIKRGKKAGSMRMKLKILWALKKSITLKPSPWWPNDSDVDWAIEKAFKRVSKGTV